MGSVGGSSGVAGARRGHVVRASGAPGVDLDDLAASRTEESKMPSGHAVAGGQHKLSARQPAPLQALMAAARERDRAHWLASPNWQPVQHAAAWWWWWFFVRRPPSSPTRLCVPTNGTLRSRHELGGALWHDAQTLAAPQIGLLRAACPGLVCGAVGAFWFYRDWLSAFERF